MTRSDISLVHQLVPTGQVLIMDASTAFIAERQTATKGVALKSAVSSESDEICTQNCTADLAQPLLEPTWTAWTAYVAGQWPQKWIHAAGSMRVH